MGDGQQINGRGRAIVAVSAIFSILAILAVIARFTCRNQLGGKRISLDDWFILAALIVTLGVTINNIIGVYLAGIAQHEHFYTDPVVGQFPYPRELKPQGQVMFALQILHTCAMPLLKASVLIFYCSIFGSRTGGSRFKTVAWLVGIYVFCWWIGILFATIFQCWPISHNFGTEPQQLGGCVPNVLVLYQTAALTNLVSDVLILAMPIPVISTLHLNTKKKIAVGGILLTGSVVVVAGIGRTVSYFAFRYFVDTDFSYHYYSLVIWTSVEPTLGVIGACLPTISPIFKGRSPASIVASVRSVLSLSSLRSVTRRSGSRGALDEDDMTNLQAPLEKGSTNKRFERVDPHFEGERSPTKGQIMKKTDFELQDMPESPLSRGNDGMHFGDTGQRV